MLRWSRIVGPSLMLITLACGDDQGNDSTTISNDDDCQSLCGCEGCPSSETETSGQTGSGTASADGSSSTSPETSTGSADGTSTASGGSGAMVCECSPKDPQYPQCPEQANCSDVMPGDECCTADGQLRVCVQNDIGVIWLDQTEC